MYGLILYTFKLKKILTVRFVICMCKVINIYFKQISYFP